jgi:hypothetical protein
MPKRMRTRPVTQLNGALRNTKRQKIRLWILEGIIVLLIGLNAYVLYSVFEPTISRSLPLKSVHLSPDSSYAHVQVEVLNGCGEVGISQQVMKYLRIKGFDVVNIDNAEHFTFPETIILDRRGERNVSESAKAVARALGTPHVILQKNENRLVDITAIIGKDFRELRFYEE